MQRPEISVVTTLYNSAPFLKNFLQETIQTIHDIGFQSYEIILVNDGSPDNSLQLAIELKNTMFQNENIKIIDLSRNFGHHYAALCGFEQCSGHLVFFIDSDLEVPPSVLKVMYQKYIENKDKGVDVIYGYQSNRLGKWSEKYSAQLFWKLFNYLSNIQIPENILSERLMTRRYVDALLKIKESNVFLAGIYYWIGFNQLGIEITRQKRREKSNYSLKRKISLFIDAITSFSSYPLYLLFWIGIFMFFITSLIILFLIIRKIIFPETILIGYTSITILLLHIEGLIILLISFIGLYISQSYYQIKNRPRYVIKEIY